MEHLFTVYCEGRFRVRVRVRVRVRDTVVLHSYIYRMKNIMVVTRIKDNTRILSCLQMKREHKMKDVSTASPTFIQKILLKITSAAMLL